MDEERIVVYTASSVRDADLLTMRLASAGIDAGVVQRPVEGGPADAPTGWPSARQVVVAEQDAEVAGEIVRQFDQEHPGAERIEAAGETASGEPPEGDGSVQQPAVWPRCPQCDALRTTKCPVCETAGTDFPQADREFLGSLGPHDEPSQAASCGCGSGGCSGAEAGSSEKEEEASCPAGGDGSPDHRSETDWPELVLMCSTCDEPFVPEYPRQCEWCGHQFAAGYEVEPPARLEQVSSRAIAVVLGLLALLAGVMLYFMLLFPAK